MKNSLILKTLVLSLSIGVGSMTGFTAHKIVNKKTDPITGVYEASLKTSENNENTLIFSKNANFQLDGKFFKLEGFDVPFYDLKCVNANCGAEIYDKVNSILYNTENKCTIEKGIGKCLVRMKNQSFIEQKDDNWKNLDLILAEQGLGTCVFRDEGSILGRNTILKLSLDACQAKEQIAINQRIGIWSTIPRNINQQETTQMSWNIISRWMGDSISFKGVNNVTGLNLTPKELEIGSGQTIGILSIDQNGKMSYAKSLTSEKVTFNEGFFIPPSSMSCSKDSQCGQNNIKTIENIINLNNIKCENQPFDFICLCIDPKKPDRYKNKNCNYTNQEVTHPMRSDYSSLRRVLVSNGHAFCWNSVNDKRDTGYGGCMSDEREAFRKRAGLWKHVPANMSHEEGQGMLNRTLLNLNKR